mgnify:FL=1
MKKFSSHLIFFNCLFYLFGFCVLSSWASQSYISYDDVYALKIEWPIFGNISIEGVSSNQIEIETVSTDKSEVNPSFSEFLKIDKVDDVVHVSLNTDTDYLLTGLDLKIQTPPDLSITIKSIAGDIFLSQLRGNVNIQLQKGDINLQKTTGQYQINLVEGKINGHILLNEGENLFSTRSGDIDLKVLDQQTAGLTLNAPDGNITLDLPDGFLASFEIWQGEEQSRFLSNAEGETDHLVSLKTGEKGKIKLSHEPRIQKSEKNQIVSEPNNQDWKPKLKFFPVPVLDFNRVNGWVLGGNTAIHSHSMPSRKYWISLTLSMTRLFGGGGNHRPLYHQLGIKQTWRWRKDGFPSITAGLLVYRVTDIINDVDQFDYQELLDASIWGIAALDYYERTGGQVWLTHQFSPACFLELTLTDENHGNLNKYTDWSLADKSQPKRGNQRIQSADLQSATLTLSLDTRNDKQTYTRFFRDRFLPSPAPTTGWLGYATVEKTYQSMVEDLDFTKLILQLTRYNQIGKNQAFNLRWQAGLLSEVDYLPQRLFYLGGLNLRGFQPRRFVGTRLVAYNIEYAYLHPRRVMGYVFSDGGYVWYKKEHRLAQYGLSLGLGTGILTQEGQIRIEVAVPFSGFYTKDNWFNSPRYALRVNQSF